MGIKHFFGWFKHNQQLKSTISDSHPDHIDHVLIDMNGIIHESAQEVFRYGKHKPVLQLPKRFLNKVRPRTELDLQLLIKKKINSIISLLNPRKTIFLAIDGVAPKSKQNQQRQRRFRAAHDLQSTSQEFNSNCITAGTEFMNNISRSLYPLDWLDNTSQFPCECIISTDSDPGEGEHKIVAWIKTRWETLIESRDDVYCVIGLDADLLLLCMLLEARVYVMRESSIQVKYIDTKAAKQLLPISIHDLVVLSCFVGNDFLPPIPSFEIRESPPEKGALDYLISFCQSHRLRAVNPHNGRLNMDGLQQIMYEMANRESAIMLARMNDISRFENPLWKEGTTIDEYRHNYFAEKMDCADKSKIVEDYVKTVQWVYMYYAKVSSGVPSWDWYYPHNYTLHADDFAKYMPTHICQFYWTASSPSHPHEQLLRVIPPNSTDLIPSYLHSEFARIAREATTFKIDMSGKREEWEAVTIVDFVNPEVTNYAQQLE